MRNYLIIALLALSYYSHSGVKDFIIKRYGLDQEFEGIFIYDIIQDDDGFLWISADDGLYKFDGQKMVNISKKDSTMSALITASVVSEDGHLYLGYFDGGISIVEHGRYRKLITSEELSEPVVKMRLDSQGRVWALTKNGSLIVIEDGTPQIKQIEFLSEANSKDFIFHRDWMYVATGEGLIRFKVTEDDFRIDGFVLGVHQISVNALYEDPFKDGVLWVGTSDGLFELPHGDNISSEHLEPVVGTEHFDISSIAKDQLETLWVGTSFHGLVEIDLLDNHVHKLTYFNKETGFPADQIRKVYVDRENEVWIGTFGNGIVQLNRAFFHHYELFKSVGVEKLTSFVEINEDLFYLGSNSGLVRGFNMPNRDSLNFELVDLPFSIGVTHILKDDDALWIGTQREGLLKYSITSNRVERIPFDTFIGNHSIRTVVNGEDNSLWVSVAGHGVYQINKQGEILNNYNTKTGFIHNEIFSILSDAAGNVWFGTYGAGLALLPSGGEMQFLTRDNVLPATDINSISQDAKGVIWIATSGAGIFSFDGEEFTNFTQDDGLLSRFCNALEVDNNGQIWIGHMKGLSLIQPEYGIVRRFNHPSELGETESVINSVMKDDLGNIWFGNPYGFTKVILPHLQHEIKERNTHILDMRVFFESTDLLNFSDQPKLDNILPNDIEFPFDKNHITFDYVAVNLKNPDAIYYKCKLEGFDKDWTPITKSNEAVYSNLDPGTYTFKVLESDHPERWTDEIHEITFKITSPYWQTWWFYLIQIVFILGLVIITAKLSKRLQSVFWIRIMIYVSLFMVFEYVHTELEPFIETLSGEGSIFEVGLNLCLALILLPLELRLAKYLKKRREKYGLSTENITAHS